MRIEFEGAIHHVFNRGNRGQAIFRDHDDYAFFVRELDVTARRYGWNCLSYCLMPNHFHLVIETPRKTLAAGMQRFAGMYAQRFNRRHGTDGHLFQGRYGNKIANSDVYFAQVLRYVALNPVTAGLCDRPEQYRWSSHRDLMARTPAAAHAHQRLAQLLAPWGAGADNRYECLFTDPGLLVAVAAEDHEPPLDKIVADQPRHDAIHAAHLHGYRPTDIAAALGIHRSTVSRILSARNGADYGADNTPSTPDAIADSQPP